MTNIIIDNLVHLKCEYRECQKDFEKKRSNHLYSVRKYGINYKKFCSAACKYLCFIPEGMLEDYSFGMSSFEIGKKYDVHPGYVIRAARYAGIKIRKNISHFCGLKNPTRGKGHTLETKKKLSKAAIKQFSDLEQRKKISLTKSRFIEKANNILNHKGKYYYFPEIDDYLNSHTKIMIRCLRCNKDFWQKPNGHLNGKGCSSCNKSKTKAQLFSSFLLRASKKYNNKYDYIKSIYEDNETPIIIICPIHNEFLQTPQSHLKGGCKKCSGKEKVTREIFLSRAKERHGNLYNYDKIEVIKNNRTKLTISCFIHGAFIQTVRCHLKGYGCPTCNESKGEKQIAAFLDKNNIKYKREYKFQDCRNKHPLPFDFYLPNYNSCIEFDGIQHFVVTAFGSKDNKKNKKRFDNIKKRDGIKTNYCERNNITLIRISYLDFENIDVLLNEKLGVKDD